MSAKELWTFTISSLAASNLICKWSEDDDISIITEKKIEKKDEKREEYISMVNVIKFQPNPFRPNKTIQIERSFINPSSIASPCAKYTEAMNENMIKWGRENFYSLLMDSVISPNMNRALPLLPQIADIEWSPKGLFHPDRCLCAVITNAGAVEVLLSIRAKWYTMFDLCEIWFDVQEKPDNLETYETYLNQARKLQGVAMTWSKLLKHETSFYAYLVIAYRSCQVAVWKMEEIQESNLKNIEPPNLVGTLKVRDSGKINCVRWVTVGEGKFLLFIGYNEGEVQCWSVETSWQGKLELTGEGQVSLDNDGIPFRELIFVKQDDSIVDILAVKNVCLVFLRFSKDGCLLEKSFSSTFGFPISGTSLLSPEKVLVSTENCKLHLASISPQGIQPKQVQHKLFSSRSRCLGLVGSRNRMIFLAVTTPSGIFDHTALKEPTSLHFFFLEEWKDPLDVLLQENEEHSLQNHWDCMELVRLKTIEHHDYASSLLDSSQSLSNSWSPYELRVILWTSAIRNSAQCKGDPLDEDIKARIHRAEVVPLLLRLVAKEHPSRDESTCLGLLKRFLRQDRSKEDFPRQVREYLRNNAEEDQREECALCLRAINELPWEKSLCPVGHMLVRCSATFMQTRTKLLSCPICRLVFHPVLEEIWRLPKCIYCDVVLRYDPRVTGSKPTPNMRNLSVILEQSKSKRLTEAHDEDVYEQAEDM